MGQIFYRVGKEDNSGLWYNQEGIFHGKIHTNELSKLQCHNLQMTFDKDIVGWLSADKSLSELKNWFSDDDMEILEPLGYKILIYEATEFRIHSNHWVINQKTSKLINGN